MLHCVRRFMALNCRRSRRLSRQLLGAERTLTAAPFRRATTFRNLVDGQNKGLVATKKNPEQGTHPGFEFIASLRLLGWAAGCRGTLGCRPARPDTRAFNIAPGLFNVRLRGRGSELTWRPLRARSRHGLQQAQNGGTAPQGRGAGSRCTPCPWATDHRGFGETR